MTININRLSREIIDVLATYTDEISDIVDKTCKEAARNTAKELRRTSPKQSGEQLKSAVLPKKTGRFIYCVLSMTIPLTVKPVSLLLAKTKQA